MNITKRLLLSIAIFLTACGGGSQGITSINAQNVALANFEGEAKHDAQRMIEAIKQQEASGKSSPYLNGLKHQLGQEPSQIIARLKPSQFKTVNVRVSADQQKASFASELSRTGLQPKSVFVLAGGSRQVSNQSKEQSLASEVVFATFEIRGTGLTARQAIDRLMATDLVEYVEIDTQQTKRLVPNDPSYGQQWHLRNTGQLGGSIFVDINAESAWNTFTGSGNEVVAVIDDGLPVTHPDFAGNLWTNPQEIAGDGIDNDGNGIIDDVYGADVVLSIGDVTPYNRNESDHGTQVAGAIAARGNNSTGVSGVMWSAKLMTLKIEGPSTNDPNTSYSTYTSDIIKAINYVVARRQAGVNVRVINISYGGTFYSQSYKDVLAVAMSYGILVVVAAGNDATDDALTVGYPSRYRMPNVISVGAMTRNDTRSTFSNYGNLVHLFAPGSEIYTTSSRPGSYTSTNGTSFAAPIVAGAVALVWDRYPSLTWFQVKDKFLTQHRQSSDLLRCSIQV